MGERFSRGDRSVKFTSGGVEALYDALVALGERRDLPSDPDARAVVDLLRAKRQAGRSFELDPPEKELASPARQRILGELVASFAGELANDVPDPTLSDISWDRDRRLSWLARILDLYDVVLGKTPDGADPSGFLELDLDHEARAEVCANRLLDAYARAKRRGDATRYVPLIDQALAALDEARANDRRAFTVYSLMTDKSEILAKEGDTQGAAALLRRSCAFVGGDEELRQATLEYADALDGKK